MDVILNKEYYGFEDAADIDRDVSEAIQDKLTSEFRGTVKITITYEEAEY